jgi:hypothetical protein
MLAIEKKRVRCKFPQIIQVVCLHSFFHETELELVFCERWIESYDKKKSNPKTATLSMSEFTL